MFRLSKIGVLPSIFLDLKGGVTLFASYMFVTAIRIQYITKGYKSGSIRKETDNNPGSVVSVDQLQSDHPVLVPQCSGKIISVHIWYLQVIVYHFSCLTYVHLIIITIQEDTLSGKEYFEIWASTFGVKINRYHADNGIFS